MPSRGEAPIMNELSRSQIIRCFVTLTFFGMFIDFFTNGVLKILWFWIYVTVYVGIAATLYNYLLTTSWRPFALKLNLSFLAGAALAHLCLTGHSHLRNYEMSLIADPPITLESPEFPDHLVVASESLQTVLEKSADLKHIPITVQVVQNYANWVWKSGSLALSSATGAPTHYSGMQAENQRLPWCLIRWF
jgi:hypothetical protein